MYVNPNIFKAYDIRGNFPEEINAKSTYIIARAFVEYLRGLSPQHKTLSIVVANDGRPSSPEMKKTVVEALEEEGVSVVDSGFSTSPLHYFTVIKAEADGGIMITASHDPQKMNGLKISKKGAEPLVGTDLEIIKNISKRAIFQKGPGNGTVVEKSFHREYVDFLVAQVDLSKAGEYTVVLDSGGGMTSVLLSHLIKRLPSKSILLNQEMAYLTPYAMLDPSKEEDLANLKNGVLEHRADFGVAFDQDGDRTGFVTRNARFFRADYMAAFFAREFLKRVPGASMIYDVRSSSIYRETIMTSGGNAIESRVGHSFIKKLMRQSGALFAAELSGHFYFKNFYALDSDFLPFLYFLEFISKSGKSSDEILAEFEVYPSSGEVSFKLEKVKENILVEIAGHFPDAREIRWTDGLSIYYDDWWANIHFSNTEALIRLNVEARTKELLDKKVEEVKKLIKG